MTFSPRKSSKKSDNLLSNPFIFPCDLDVVHLRNRDILYSNKEKEFNKRQLVENKGIISKKIVSKSFRKHHNDSNRFSIESKVDLCDPKSMLKKSQNYLDDQKLFDYISKKRSIFLVEYSLNIKKEDLQNLEHLALLKENELMEAEKLLEEDATNFDEFLRATNILTQKALNAADECGKTRLEKNNLTKQLNNDITILKTEMSKNHDILQNLKKYKRFLESLLEMPTFSSNEVYSISKAKLTDDVSEISNIFRNKPIILNYFNCPKDILIILSDLEEKNLSLILNSQEIEESLDALCQSSNISEKDLNANATALSHQISLIENTLVIELMKSNDLEYKAKMFSYGEFKEEDQEYLKNIDIRVQMVYNHCIGHNEANIATIQMLSSIENKVEEIFELLETLPNEKVKIAEFTRAKERRFRIRERKLQEQRMIQDERIQKSLARSNASTRVENSKKLIFRSNPIKLKRIEPQINEMKNKFEEENIYFFS